MEPEAPTPSPGGSPARPAIVLAIAILAVSVSAILIRLTVTPPLVTAFYRQLFCAILILPFAGGEQAATLSRRNQILLIVSGLFLAVHFATWISSLFYTTVARATLFVDLQPVWAAILGTLFLRERLSALALAGVGIVTVGGCVTVAGSWDGGGSRLAGDLLAVTGGIAGAAYLVIGRGVRFAIPWARYMLAVYGISAAWLLVLCLGLSGGQFPLPAERDLVWITLMAIGPGILGHGLINLAIRDLKAYAVNAALLGEPVIATILAYFLFREVPDAFYYAGAALIFAGLLLVFRRNSDATTKNQRH